MGPVGRPVGHFGDVHFCADVRSCVRKSKNGTTLKTTYGSHAFPAALAFQKAVDVGGGCFEEWPESAGSVNGPQGWPLVPSLGPVGGINQWRPLVGHMWNPAVRPEGAASGISEWGCWVGLLGGSQVRPHGAHMWGAQLRPVRLSGGGTVHGRVAAN